LDVWTATERSWKWRSKRRWGRDGVETEGIGAMEGAEIGVAMGAKTGETEEIGQWEGGKDGERTEGGKRTARSRLELWVF